MRSIKFSCSSIFFMLIIFSFHSAHMHQPNQHLDDFWQAQADDRFERSTLIDDSCVINGAVLVRDDVHVLHDIVCTGTLRAAAVAVDSLALLHPLEIDLTSDQVADVLMRCRLMLYDPEAKQIYITRQSAEALITDAS